MLCMARDDPFDAADFLFEIKWDGTRCLAYRDPDRIRLQNRRNLEMRSRYPDLTGLERLPGGTLLDGEIVVLEDGKPSFPKLQQREHLSEPRKIEMASRRLPATYLVFDLLYLGGRSLLAEPLAERRRLLAEQVEELADPHVVLSQAVEGEGTRLFHQVDELGLEGIIAKRTTSPYLPGKRSDHWLKIKTTRTEVFDVIGYRPRPDEPAIRGLLVGERVDGSWEFRASVGSGLTEKDRTRFFAALEQADDLEDPPDADPEDAVWKSTGLACRVRYLERTESGKLRAPVFVELLRADS